MIDLGLDEIEGAVVHAIDRIVEGAAGPGWQVTEQGCVLDADLWSHLSGLLVSDADTPEEDRATLLICELAAERFGSALVGLPLIDHVVAIRLLDAIGDDAAAFRRDVATSAAPVALLIPAEQSRDAQPPLSPTGAIARWIVRALPDGTIDCLDILDGEKCGFVPNLSDLPVGRAAMNDPRWRALTEDRAEAVAMAVAERKVLVSGAIAGLCERALGLAVDYANERELFGAPIGSFQSLAHGLAAAKVRADGTQLLAREAAWARDNAPERFEMLSRMAYAHAAAAGDEVTRAAVHIFGGYGLTREYPAQAYYRMARALCLFTGDRRIDLQRIGRELVDARSDALGA